VKSIFNKIFGVKGKNDAITIVSGLPRSGTSMMMRMLEAGGMPVVKHNITKPDEDNPLSYFQFVSWLADCRGKAVKMVSELLYYAPKEYNYKVIFIRRKMQEVLASQRLILERLEQESAGPSDEEMGKIFEKHLEKVEDWLTKKTHTDVLHVKYNDVIADPHRNARTVNSFLGEELDVEKMAGVVEKSLYRQRRK